MKSKRGIITLVVAVVCGLFAAKLSIAYLKRIESQKRPEREFDSNMTPVNDIMEPSFTKAIPKGLRAISVPVDEVTGVSNKVKRGDYVDVVITTPVPGKISGRVSRLLLQSVEVLSAARDSSNMPAESILGGRRQNDTKWVVTLLLNQMDAAAVAAADATGKLSLLVRNPEDRAKSAFLPAVAFTCEDGVSSYEGKIEQQKIENDLNGLIRPGMRAFSLPAKHTDGVGGDIKPGDRVDVVLTCPFSHFASKGQDIGDEGQITSTHMASRIFLQNVEVLAIKGKKRIVTALHAMPDPEAQPMPEFSAKDNDKVVVLHVTPEEAELLAVAVDATSKSVLRLISRSPDDNRKITTDGQLLIELLTEKKEYRNVEVLRGTERQVRKFFKYTKGGIATRSEVPTASPDTETRENK